MTDQDTRVTCTACANKRGGWCVNAAAAQLRHVNGRAEIGPALAALRQRCFGFKAKGGSANG